MGSQLVWDGSLTKEEGLQLQPLIFPYGAIRHYYSI